MSEGVERESAEGVGRYEADGRFKAYANPTTEEWEVRGPDGSEGWGTYPAGEDVAASRAVTALQRAYQLGRLIGRTESAAIEETRGKRAKTAREVQRDAMAPVAARWAADCVDPTGDRAASVYDVETSYTNWLMFSGIAAPSPKPTTKTLLREVLGDQMIASGARWDQRAKRYRGVKLV